MFGMKKIFEYEWTFEIWWRTAVEGIPDLYRIYHGFEPTRTGCKKRADELNCDFEIEVGGVKFTRYRTKLTPKPRYKSCGPIDYLRNKRVVAEDEGLSRNYDVGAECAYQSGFYDAEVYYKDRYGLAIVWLTSIIVGIIVMGVLTKLQIL